MFGKNNFCEGPIYTALEYIFWFCIINIYFIICNIPFVITFYCKEISYNNLNYFIISLIPFGPAIVALYASMGKIIRDKTIKPTFYYFQSYKNNFKTSIKLWIGILLIYYILIFDINFALNINKYGYLFPLLIIMLVLFINFSTILLVIFSRFEFKFNHLVKLAFYYTVKKPFLIISNTLALLLMVFVVFKAFAAIIFFFFSLIAYWITYNCKKMLNEIETEIIDQGDRAN